VRDDAELSQVELVLPVPMPQPGAKYLPAFKRHTKVMQKKEALGSTGYSLYTAELNAMEKSATTYVLWYSLRAQGRHRHIDMPFIPWKGLKSCHYSEESG
jgi:hypothetical protein